MSGTIHRNALAPAHEAAREMTGLCAGVETTLDAWSRRPAVEIPPALLAILLADIAQIEAGLVEIKTALAGQADGAPARQPTV